VIYDVAGKLIERLVDRGQGPGDYSVIWDAGTLPSGVYFYRLQTGGAIKTRKLILLK
jgi:hypothetical protein